MAHNSFIKAPNLVRLLFKEFDEASMADQLQKLLFFLFSSFMMFGALVWGFLCLSYGFRMPSLIPFAYVILTLFNFLVSGSSAFNLKISCHVQIAASLVLPFVFQHALGGIAASGIVMLWSLPALLGSLILQEKKFSYIWVGLFLGGIIASFYVEGLRPEESIHSVPIILTSLNVILISLMIFALSHYFASMQGKMAKMLYSQKLAMRSAAQVLEDELSAARSFQQVFHKENSLKLSEYKHFEITSSKNGITGNFTWAGSYGNKNVTVFIENPCSGIRGSLEAMFLSNLIHSGVVKQRKKGPLELIGFIQAELFARYDSLDIRNGMKEIGATVLYHDTITNQLFYSAIDTNVVIGSSLDKRVVCGFNSSYSETVVSENGTSVVNGHVIIEPGMRIVMANGAMLKSRGITTDEEMINGNNGLQSLLTQDLHTAEKKLLIEIEKSNSLDDIFIQCIEF